MGMQLEITCTKCRVHRTESLGVGMRGSGSELRVCDTCGKIVIQPVNVLLDVKPPVKLCPKCGTEPILLYPRDDVDQYSDADFRIDLGQHPRCGGRLTGQETGLLWD